MFCTNCGKQNEEGQAFCIHCGSSMPQAEKSVAYCTNCGKELKDGTKFCIHCGVARQSAQPEPSRCPDCGDPVEPGVRFCIRCGTSLQPAMQTAPAQALPVESKRTGIDLLLICLPLLLNVVSNILFWKYHTEAWFIYSCDDNFFLIMVLVSFVVPLLCLWAGVSRTKQRSKCRTAQVFAILDMLLPLALLGLIISEEPHNLSRNLPYMVLCLSRSVVAILALSTCTKKA